jgi:hypothetical protein
MGSYFVITEQNGVYTPLKNTYSDSMKIFNRDVAAHMAGLYSYKKFEIFKIGEGVDFSWTVSLGERKQ